MNITEVRVKILGDHNDKLRAFCSITLDDSFVIRDLKIVEGSKGAFVAMPSRKLMDRCPNCGGKNHLRANFCNDCGTKLAANRAEKDAYGRARLHADVAHPINPATREVVQQIVLQAYRDEVERSRQPGYVPPRLDLDEDLADDDYETHNGNGGDSGPARAASSRNAEPQSQPGGALHSRAHAPSADRPALPNAHPPAPDRTTAEPDDNFASGLFR